jgi:putative endonuclease
MSSTLAMGFPYIRGILPNPIWRPSADSAQVRSTGDPLEVCPRSSREKGAIGEEIAMQYLRHEGFTILNANFHAASGEIDIIAQDDEMIVFVEVKSTTKETQFGDPLQWIPVWKQQRIIRASLAYLKIRGMIESPMRFDVITVDKNKKVFHVRDAFRASGPFSV